MSLLYMLFVSGSEDKASGRKSPFAFFKKEKDEQAERRKLYWCDL